MMANIILGIYFAQTYGYTYHLLWQAPFKYSDIFQPTDLIKLHTHKLYISSFHYDAAVTLRYGNSLDEHFDKDNTPIHNPSLFETELAKKRYNRLLSKDNQSLKSIFLYHWTLRVISPLSAKITLSKLKIKKNIINKVNTFINKHKIDKTWIGLHIRATDCPAAIKDSSGIYRYIKDNPDKKFFVCSDDRQVEEKLCSLPNAFHRAKKFYTIYNKATNSVKRVRFDYVEAFIDVLILSRTTLGENIIRAHGPRDPFGSTFFQLAYYYNMLESLPV